VGGTDWGKEKWGKMPKTSTSVVKTCVIYLNFADKRKRLVQMSRIKEIACNNTQFHSNADGQTKRIAIISDERDMLFTEHGLWNGVAVSGNSRQIFISPAFV